MPDLIHDTPAAHPADSATQDDRARQQTVRQIERKRLYRSSAAVSGLGMMLLVLIWAVSQYHDAGGWPAQGFSQSSGIHDVWSLWIVYPVGAWLLLVAAGGWNVHLRKPLPGGLDTAKK
ncbi:MAG: hypothetical protein ABR926_01770 [Streptosporangiaceae bacterium]|jgi:hypothetical protein